MALQTKEHTALSWPGALDDEDAQVGRSLADHAQGNAPDLERARAALAAEWRGANPRTPQEISAFYASAQRLGEDLGAWHALPERQEWTRMLVHVAQQAAAAKREVTDKPFQVVDIGCGAGHDLIAIEAALPQAAELEGVEPNVALRTEMRDLVHPRIRLRGSVDEAGIGTADLLICVDVLEHVPDPEGFLGSIAQRAPVGCLLFEATATHDVGTPLHLAANRGWHPGRVLEQRGWEMADKRGRVRVWRRVAAAAKQRASVLLCAYRSVGAESLASLMALCAGSDAGNRWRLRVKTADALIARSRSIILSAWWRETADDCCLMVDDDVSFSPADADRATELCRGGYDIVCGAYPVHDGAHLACRCLPGTQDVRFGPGEVPLAIQYAATGFMVVHRRVLDALVPTLPLCHAKEPWSFYPFFQPFVMENEGAGGHEWLSEDFGFSELARRAGCGVWLDTQTVLAHHGPAAVSVRNMAAMQQAIKDV